MAISVRTLFAVALLGVAARFCDAARGRSPPGGKKFSLVFFGDSLTDTGNSFKAAGVPDPAIYYKGRLTNGPNWVDYLRTTLSKKAKVQVHNYAFAGATACASPYAEAVLPYVKNMTAQIATFAADIKRKKVRLADSKTLVLQFMGADDLLFFFEAHYLANTYPTPLELMAIVSNTVACRIQGAAALAALPGVTDIAILPIPPVYSIPAVIPDSDKPELIALEDLLHNQTAAAIAVLNAQLVAAGSAVKVYMIGDYKWIVNGEKRVEPPFVHFDEPCFRQPLSALIITPGLKTCKDPENYLYYDQDHPTTRYHEWFANKGLLPRLQTLGLLL